MYATISKFGQNNSVSNDPLTYCLTQTVDTEFHHPTAPEKFTGPHSRNCQLFMAQRCADNWDGFCEYASYNTSKSYPNQVQTGNIPSLTACRDLSTGDSLIHNATQRRFCKFPNCEMKSEPFDPNVASSPNVFYYTNESGYGDCVPVCTVDPSTIDNDTLMNKCLSNPKVATDVLINICNTSKRQGINLSGTKIGQFCEAYFQEKSRLPQNSINLGNPLSKYTMYTGM